MLRLCLDPSAGAAGDPIPTPYAVQEERDRFLAEAAGVAAMSRIDRRGAKSPQAALPIFSTFTPPPSSNMTLLSSLTSA